MNDLKIFNSQEFGQIRTVTINNEPWFVGKDVVQALGYKDAISALKSHVDIEDKGVGDIQTSGGKQKMTVINESGLYALIFGSKLESAKRFKRWVTAEVLPAIRKTGSYGKGDDDIKKWLAVLVVQASSENLEYLRRLYPEYLGVKPVIPFNTGNDSFEAWVSDISGDKGYICSVPTAQLYSEYFCFCDFKFLSPIGKKTFYKKIENEFGLSRCQKSDGYRYFIGGECRDISGS